MGDQEFEEILAELNELLGRWPVLEEMLVQRFGVLLVGYLLEDSEVLIGHSYRACLEVLGKAHGKAADILATAQELAEGLACQETERAIDDIAIFLERLRGKALCRIIRQSIQQEYPTIELWKLRQLHNKLALSRYVSARGVAPVDLLRLLREAKRASCRAPWMRIAVRVGYRLETRTRLGASL